MTNNTFLLTKFYYARFYAVRTLDEELYAEQLYSIIDADPDILPQYSLITQIAKNKAEIWLKKKVIGIRINSDRWNGVRADNLITKKKASKGIKIL